MNQSDNTPYAFIPTWYVPRHYADQWYGLYGHPSRRHRSERPFASEFFPTRTPPRDGPQTVEQVVARGYLAIPDAEPESAILGDKRSTAWLGLDDLVSQIRRRHELYTRNSYELELAKCGAMNDLYAREAEQGRPANERQRYALGKRIQELYAEQRAERITLWKDVSRLRMNIPESAQLYLSAHRKLAILDSGGGGEGDAP